MGEVEGTASLKSVCTPYFPNQAARAAMNWLIGGGYIPYAIGGDGIDDVDPAALGFENIKNWY